MDQNTLIPNQNGSAVPNQTVQNQHNPHELSSTFPPPPPFWMLYSNRVLQGNLNGATSKKGKEKESGLVEESIKENIALIKIILQPLIQFQQQLFNSTYSSSFILENNMESNLDASIQNEQDNINNNNNNIPSSTDDNNNDKPKETINSKNLEIASLILESMFKFTSDKSLDLQNKPEISFLDFDKWNLDLNDFGDLTKPPPLPKNILKNLSKELNNGNKMDIDNNNNNNSNTDNQEEENEGEEEEEIGKTSKYLSFGMVHEYDFEKAANSKDSLTGSGARNLIQNNKQFHKNKLLYLKKLLSTLFLNLLELLKILSINPSVFEYKVLQIKEIVINFHHYINIYRFFLTRHQLANIIRNQIADRKEITKTIKESIEKITKVDLELARKSLKDAISKEDYDSILLAELNKS